MLQSIDPTRSQAKISLQATSAERLGESTWQNFERILNRAAVLFAFEQLGGADACLQMCKEYSLERYAFGRPIGSYQAVKHRMVDMFAKNQLARSNCYFGAWALDSDADEVDIAGPSARVSGCQAYHFASKENVQLHGGIGYTWEADTQFHYRRSRLLGSVIGSELVWKQKMMSELGKKAA